MQASFASLVNEIQNPRSSKDRQHEILHLLSCFRILVVGSLTLWVEGVAAEKERCGVASHRRHRSLWRKSSSAMHRMAQVRELWQSPPHPKSFGQQKSSGTLEHLGTRTLERLENHWMPLSFDTLSLSQESYLPTPELHLYPKIWKCWAMLDLRKYVGSSLPWKTIVGTPFWAALNPFADCVWRSDSLKLSLGPKNPAMALGLSGRVEYRISTGDNKSVLQKASKLKSYVFSFQITLLLVSRMPFDVRRFAEIP